MNGLGINSSGRKKFYERRLQFIEELFTEVYLSVEAAHRSFQSICIFLLRSPQNDAIYHLAHVATVAKGIEGDMLDTKGRPMLTPRKF